jgi:hypothetical protein
VRACAGKGSGVGSTPRPPSHASLR